MSREPSQATFVPIGHISLDSKNKDAERLDLDIPKEGVFWIKTFFVLQSLQSRGIGRAAMDEVESMAVREPLWARTLMLDTVQKEDQMREDFAKATYGVVPKVRFLTLDSFLGKYLLYRSRMRTGIAGGDTGPLVRCTVTMMFGIEVGGSGI